LETVKAAAERGRAKLVKYYSRTGDAQGYLFNYATILDLSQKLTAYEHMYREQFLEYLKRYNSSVS
ncbi:hypothetical protein CC86DRAFT_301563, partial [Ophiobolus disseminans]